MIRLEPGQPGYPQRLRRIAGSPDPLWVWGTLPPEKKPTVGIVGTRRVTPLGTRLARLISTTLARAGAVVVSGLAQGVDSAAHEGALDSGGATVAVLGEGLAHFDERAPHRRRPLAKRIRAQGALVSEYPLDTRPSGWTFPRRNRTIAGLSDVLIVVEAPPGSGALITAAEMKQIGREVYVVPGPLDAPTWQGSNAFIGPGKGRLMLNIREVADRLHLELGQAASATTAHDGSDRLSALLSAEPADADRVAAELGITAAEAATLLAEELIAGRIMATGDGRFGLR